MRTYIIYICIGVRLSPGRLSSGFGSIYNVHVGITAAHLSARSMHVVLIKQIMRVKFVFRDNTDHHIPTVIQCASRDDGVLKSPFFRLEYYYE